MKQIFFSIVCLFLLLTSHLVEEEVEALDLGKRESLGLEFNTQRKWIALTFMQLHFNEALLRAAYFYMVLVSISLIFNPAGMVLFFSCRCSS